MLVGISVALPLVALDSKLRRIRVLDPPSFHVDFVGCFLKLRVDGGILSGDEAKTTTLPQYLSAAFICLQYAICL